jgi:hypothetical protein
MDRALLEGETERLLRTVLVEVQEQLGPEQRAGVLEHLQRHELGPAHDTLVAAIQDRKLALGAEGTTALEAAQDLLEFEA